MISIIVATAKNGVIGKAGGLPWHLPAELAYFKQKTMGHPIIMGYVTQRSIGRVLPGRTNIVISDFPDTQIQGCTIASSLKDAIKAAKKAEGGEEIFVIGGALTYQQALPLADRIYLTKISAKINGDKFFKFSANDWTQTSSEKHLSDEKNEYDYEFTVLEHKKA